MLLLTISIHLFAQNVIIVIFSIFPQSQLFGLRLILNSTAGVVSQTPKLSHIIPVLK